MRTLNVRNALEAPRCILDCGERYYPPTHRCEKHEHPFEPDRLDDDLYIDELPCVECWTVGHGRYLETIKRRPLTVTYLDPSPLIVPEFAERVRFEPGEVIVRYEHERMDSFEVRGWVWKRAA